MHPLKSEDFPIKLGIGKFQNQHIIRNDDFFLVYSLADVEF